MMAYRRLEIGISLVDNSIYMRRRTLHNLPLIALTSCNRRKSVILYITWQLNKVPNVHPTQQVRALADWRKTEALAVTSSEVRRWSSTRSIPTSTGRAQSVWSGPASQTSLTSSPAVESFARPVPLSEIATRGHDINSHSLRYFRWRWESRAISLWCKTL